MSPRARTTPSSFTVVFGHRTGPDRARFYLAMSAIVKGKTLQISPRVVSLGVQYAFLSPPTRVLGNCFVSE